MTENEETMWLSDGIPTPWPHAYERDPQSGAGNCVCGAAERHARHPHAFTQAANFEACVCTKLPAHPIHTDADTAALAPKVTVEDAVRAARGGPAPVRIEGWA